MNEIGEIWDYFSEHARGIDHNDEWYLVTHDVCDRLGIQSTSQAMRRIPGFMKAKVPFLMRGKVRKVWIISEAGLDILVIRSNKRAAEAIIMGLAWSKRRQDISDPGELSRPWPYAVHKLPA